MTFEIIENKLERNSEIKVLKLESDEYITTIFYFGDYKTDMEAGGCFSKNLTLVGKPKKDAFALSCMCGNVVLEIPAYPVVMQEQVEQLKNSLDVSREAAAELQEILHKFFHIMPE